MSKQIKLMLDQMTEIVNKYNNNKVVVVVEADNTEITNKVKEFTLQFNSDEKAIEKIVKILSPKGKSSFMTISDEEDLTLLKLFYNKTGLNVPTANFIENKFVVKDLKDAIRDKKKLVSVKTVNPLKAIREKMLSEKKVVNAKTLAEEAKCSEEEATKFLKRVEIGAKMGSVRNFVSVR